MGLLLVLGLLADLDTPAVAGKPASSGPRQYEVLVETHTRDVVPATKLSPALLTLKHVHGVLVGGWEDTGRIRLVIETSSGMAHADRVPVLVEYAEAKSTTRPAEEYLLDLSYRGEEITAEDLRTLGVTLEARFALARKRDTSGVLVVRPDSGSIDGALARRIERCPRVRYACVHVGPARYEER
jgi:hypothetical protein